MRLSGRIFSDTDLSTEAGTDEMLKSIEPIVEWAYNAGTQAYLKM